MGNPAVSKLEDASEGEAEEEEDAKDKDEEEEEAVGCGAALRGLEQWARRMSLSLAGLSGFIVPRCGTPVGRREDTHHSSPFQLAPQPD